MKYGVARKFSHVCSFFRSSWDIEVKQKMVIDSIFFANYDQRAIIFTDFQENNGSFYGNLIVNFWTDNLMTGGDAVAW